ncbi:hypothetical protein H0H93_014821, partial [Arthromyces matolae]
WEAIRGAFNLFDYDHDSFEVIKKETQFGGYEVLQRKVFPIHGVSSLHPIHHPLCKLIIAPPGPS